jgi:hypothetical protein
LIYAYEEKEIENQENRNCIRAGTQPERAFFSAATANSVLMSLYKD